MADASTGEVLWEDDDWYVYYQFLQLVFLLLIGPTLLLAILGVIF